MLWKRWVNGCQLSDLANDYSNLEDSYYAIKSRMEEFEEDNHSLVGENSELRQASLDGIAIADAIEELS
jgi:hypothetical protein